MYIRHLTWTALAGPQNEPTTHDVLSTRHG